MERHFSIKSGQPRGMALAIFYPFPYVLQWSGKFYSDRSKWTQSRGGPEYSSLKKPKLNTECLLLSLHKLNENFIMIESYRRKEMNTKLEPKSPRKLTNRFHVAARLLSNRSQMTSKCGKNKNWHTRG